MPWIAVDCQMPSHPKMAALPSDTARYGWVVTLTEAKLQRKAGEFASAQHFRHVLGKYGRFLPDYIKAGLLDEVDGVLYVHDWQRHQWAAAKAGQREDKPETSEGHSEDISKTETGLTRASRAVPVLVDVSSSEGVVKGEVAALQHLAEELTGRPYVMANVYAGLGLKAVTEQLDLHGISAVEGAWRQVHSDHDGRVTLRQLVLEADNILNPLNRPRTPKDEKQANIDALRAEAQRRAAASV